MANEIQTTAATGTPQRVDARDIDYSGTTRCRTVVGLSSQGTDPTFWALTGNLTPTANRFQFVLYNGASSAIIRVKRLTMIPIGTAVTGSTNASVIKVRVRIGPTTDPTGTGGLTIQSFDSADSLPSGIVAFSNPGTIPAGGSAVDYWPFIPPTWELMGTGTVTTPSTDAFTNLGGLVLYESAELLSAPITLRNDECLEVVQGTTAGSFTVYQMHCIFSAF